MSSGWAGDAILRDIRRFVGISEVSHNPQNYQQILGSISIINLSDVHCLFGFGVLASMGHLHPIYYYKYCNAQRDLISARLTFFGHTVVVNGSALSPYEIKVELCKKALEKMRRYTPRYLIAPLPSEEGTDHLWCWTMLLQEFCVAESNKPPIYSPSLASGTNWNCDVSVMGKLFRITIPCASREEAQNTASHYALFRLITVQGTFHILPPDPPGFEQILEDVEIKVEAHRSLATTEEADQREMDELLKAQELEIDALCNVHKEKKSQMVRKQAKRKALMIKAHVQRTELKNYPIENRTRKSMHNPNYEPVRNPRLTPILEACEDDTTSNATSVVDAVLLGLETMSNGCSFPTMLMKLCDILHVTYPSFTCRPDIRPVRRNYHFFIVEVSFDRSNHHLHQASPIALFNDYRGSQETHQADAITKTILHLLLMVQEDAAEEPHNPNIHKLHSLVGELIECTRRLIVWDVEENN
ncbi:hypothetical protein N7495_007240 [Penicillium taxi]|uniref:uncharacterized protein n=1 Tax=Penicillium taxi TaxID=168475 RepID=UPI0025458501|nr:uncharacterized protein N7495_007240 [Penicillium taxi]KAJ5895549.1 hypothetical protein N7495_007240 [Penicillium taxi]